MKNNSLYALFIAGLLSGFPVIQSGAQGISKVGCFDQSGHLVECGNVWYPVKDGVTYKCVCNCNGTDQCTPLSSSSSSNNNYSSGSNDIRMTVATAVVGGLFNALNKWINSSSSNNTSSSAQSKAPATRELTEAEKAEIERKRAEYRQRVLDQVNHASAEYATQMNQDFSQKQQSTVNDLKTKFVRSESVKSIKQVNCAAYKSILAAKENCKLDINSFTGSMEQAKSTADFASGIPSDCPEITFNIPDVTPAQPIGFQQVYYETVKYKSDSINSHVSMLKESNKVIQKNIDEKKQVVEKLKSDDLTPGKNDQLLQEAMKALNESKEEQESITEEIKASEKNLEIYDMMRSAYDVDKTKETSKTKEITTTKETN
jgi:hypothetical protein